MVDILDGIWKARHEKDVLFLSIIEGYIIQKCIDKPYIHLYIQRNKILIEYNSLSQTAWINYNSLWSVFSIKYNLSYYKTIELMKYMLETHLNLKGTFPDFSEDDMFEINSKILKPIWIY